jgi:hypothetical protein
MAENRNFSPAQQKIIKRFYDNRDQLDEQHLAENVTNLYLENGRGDDGPPGSSGQPHSAHHGEERPRHPG